MRSILNRPLSRSLLCLLWLLVFEAGAQGPATPPADIAPLMRRPAENSVLLSLAEQRRRGVIVIVTPVDTQRSPQVLFARVIADPSASIRVDAPVSGRLTAPAQGFPRPGQRVKRGELLAWLEPILTPAERSALGTELAFAKRDLGVTELKLEQFRIGYGGRVISADNGPTVLPGLQAEKRGAQKRIEASAQGLVSRRAVTAPQAGVLGDGLGLDGRAVTGGEVLFELLEPSRLWLETVGADTSLPAVALAITASGDFLRLQLAGISPTLSGASVAARFRVIEGSENLIPGQALNLHLMPDEDGTATLDLPVSALSAMDSDMASVWTQQDAAHFVMRRVRVKPLGDGRWRVLRGLLPGERVVVAGLPPPPASD